MTSDHASEEGYGRHNIRDDNPLPSRVSALTTQLAIVYLAVAIIGYFSV